MPRTARVAPSNHIYHVLTRGNDRRDIFRDETDYELYMDLLLRYKEKFRFKLYHFALMKNHVHLVLETTDKGGSLSEIMKGINLSYAQYYKGKYKHIGHFWQDRFKSIVVSDDEYLLACGSYVELNPVRAKVVDDPGGYKWSSYKAYAYGKRDVITDQHPIYQGLSENDSERRLKYREFVKGMLKEKNAMKGEMDKRTVYGNENFTERIKNEYQVDCLIKPKGRPKKVVGGEK